MYNISELLGNQQQDIKKIYEDGARVIDVRGIDEFSAGHFEGATNIPLDIIATKAEDLRRYGKPLILVCRSGARSGIATNILKTAGLEAYNGGGWTDFNARVKG